MTVAEKSVCVFVCAEEFIGHSINIHAVSPKIDVKQKDAKYSPCVIFSITSLLQIIIIIITQQGGVQYKLKYN